MATKLKLNIRPITSSVGAVIEGLDLRRPLEPETVAEIRKAWLDHGVVFFQDQDITPEQYWTFMGYLGQPQYEETGGSPEDTAADLATSNYAVARHSTAVWHADTTSLAAPPIATALRLLQVPPVGGDTCWSNVCDAYDALSEPMKAMLDGLTAVHTIQLTYDRMQDFAQHFQPKYDALHAAEQIHPVVLTHKETGRKALYVNESFTTRIVELSSAESAAILSVLYRHIESPLFTMRWRWSANDLALWDNRSVQHFAVPDYSDDRIVQRVVLAGERPGGDTQG